MRPNYPMNVIIQQNEHTQPACPSCGRGFGPGRTWPGSNYCRGLFLLWFIQDTPGKSAWELCQISGLPYTDTSRGLAKLREWGLVSFTSEEREAGGVRYRYFVADNPARRHQFTTACDRSSVWGGS